MISLQFCVFPNARIAKSKNMTLVTNISKTTVILNSEHTQVLFHQAIVCEFHAYFIY